MSRISYNLGYGQFADIELDPFTKLLTGQVSDYEQVRFDKPDDFINSFEFAGIANEDALTSDKVWGIARLTWVNNKKVRVQYRGQVAWDDRRILDWGN